MKDVIIHNDKTKAFYVVGEETWEKIKTAQETDVSLFIFNGRVPGVKTKDGFTVYLRDVATKVGPDNPIDSGTWQLEADLELNEQNSFPTL